MGGQCWKRRLRLTNISSSAVAKKQALGYNFQRGGDKSSLAIVAQVLVGLNMHSTMCFCRRTTVFTHVARIKSKYNRNTTRNTVN